jgi:hypothetical protein
VSTAFEPISIRYTLTNTDLEQLVMHGKSRLFGWSGKTQQWVVMGYFAVAIVLVAIGLPAFVDMGQSFLDKLPFYLGLGVPGLIVIGLYPKFLRWSIKRSSMAYQTLPLPLSLVVDEGGIKAELDGQSGHTAWRVMTRAIETESHFLIYLNRLRGYVIPKSALVDEVTMQRFRQLIGRHIVDRKLSHEVQS